MKRVLLLCTLAACTQKPPPGGGSSSSGTSVRMVAVDVGQGDCSLLVGTDGSAILIDGGGLNRGATVKSAVDREADGNIQAVIVTHYDADHLAGLADFLLGPDRMAGTADDGAPGATIYDYGDDAACGTQTCQRYRQSRAIRGQQAVPGQSFTLGEATVEVVVVNGHLSNGDSVPTDDENSRSVGVVFTHGSFRAFFGGDLTGGGNGTADVETPVARLVGRVDLLRANHHGSATSSNSMALSLFSPRAAILSVGTDNSYCHPNQGALDRLLATGAVVHATGQGITMAAGTCMVTQWTQDATDGEGSIHVEAWQDGAVEIEGVRVP